jgi:hypothetical protein
VISDYALDYLGESNDQRSDSTDMDVQDPVRWGTAVLGTGPLSFSDWEFFKEVFKQQYADQNLQNQHAAEVFFHC